MTAMFKSPQKPDTSKQEALLAKQEAQLDREEAERKKKRQQSAATSRSRTSGTAGLLSGSDLGVTPVGRQTIG